MTAGLHTIWGPYSGTATACFAGTTPELEFENPVTSCAGGKVNILNFATPRLVICAIRTLAETNFYANYGNVFLHFVQTGKIIVVEREYKTRFRVSITMRYVGYL